MPARGPASVAGSTFGNSPGSEYRCTPPSCSAESTNGGGAAADRSPETEGKETPAGMRHAPMPAHAPPPCTHAVADRQTAAASATINRTGNLQEAHTLLYRQLTAHNRCGVELVPASFHTSGK